jgi:hypothetical protein
VADHRGAGTGGEPDQPEEGQPHSDAEPEFGSSEWLLAQLTGGRRVERGDDAEGTDLTDGALAADGAPAADGAVAAGVDGSKNSRETTDEVASLHEAAAAADGPVAPADEVSAPVGFAELLREPAASAAEAAAEHSANATSPIASAPQGFVWNLTSRQSEDRDEMPEPLGTEAREAETAQVDEAAADEGDSNPPVRRTNFVEPKAAPTPETPPAAVGPVAAPSAPPQASAEPSPPAGFEPSSLVAALRMPRPPEWGDAPSTPVESPASSDGAPSAVEPGADALASGADPEARPPAADTAPLQGHGLAALLGGASPQDAPASRPLLGDTTGIVPLPPSYIPPAATPPVPESTPEPVTADMTPLDTPPVSRREARRAEEAAGPSMAAPVPPSPIESSPIESAPPEPVPAPDATPFGGAAQTEAVLGAPPSPATSPFDAEALADATMELPTAATPVDSTWSVTPTAAPDESGVADATSVANEQEGTDRQGSSAPDTDGTDATDGIAALFGDFALDDDSAPDDHSAPDDDSTPGSGADGGAGNVVGTTHAAAKQEDAHDGSLGLDAILFPGSADEPDEASERAVPEASAAMEGPQLGVDAAADFDELDAIGPPTVAFDAAAAAREPLPPAAFTPAPTTPARSSSSVAGPPAASSLTSHPEPPTTAPGSTPPVPPDPPRGPRDPRFNRRVYLIAGVLAVLLVLVGLFALGTRIPSLFGAAAPSPHASASRTPSPTPTPTPTPTVIPKPAAAVGLGDHAWDTLGGGECIQPYTSPWAETFTVVDCTTDHTAQMVYTNLISADPVAPYPGADALAQQINTLCTAGGLIDLSAAGAYPDLQVQGTFPATEEQWKSGQRSYYCFASRSSGQPLSTSVQGQGPTG